MDGYKYCKGILEHPHGGVKALLERAKNSECEWLEFKASIQLLKEDEDKGCKNEDVYWSIANAVIAMMNTYGGAVIIGIDDKSHDRVPLEDNDPDKIIKTQGIGAYLLDIHNKIWSAPNGTKSWGSKNRFYVDSPLPQDQIEIKSFPYQNGPVAVILVKPKIPCLKVWKGSPPNAQEQLRFRSHGDIGKTETIIGNQRMNDYEKNRQIQVVYPFFDQDYKIFTEHLPENRKKSQIFCEWSIIALLIIISCVIWFLPGVSVLIRILITLGGLFSLWILPVIFPPPPVKPIHGKKTPDQIIVPHPFPTIEGQCLNNKHWWTVSGSEIDTCYGKWELQRHKVFGLFRIIDPRNITRCWGTQKMVVPVFDKLHEQLEKECPPQETPDSK